MTRRPRSLVLTVWGALAVLVALAGPGPVMAAGHTPSGTGHLPAGAAARAVTAAAGTTTISGVVRGVNGRQVRRSGGDVVLYQNGRRIAGAPASIQSDGTYTIADVAPGRHYRVCATVDQQTGCYDGASTVDQARDLTVGSTPLSGIDIGFAPSGRITGTVTLAGAPVDAVISLYRRSAYLGRVDQFYDQVGLNVFTTHGRFTIPRVTPGSYVIEADDDAGHRIETTFSGNVGRPAAAVPFTVTSGATTVADIAARRADLSGITGTMRSADGTPQAGRVELYPAQGDGPALGAAYTDASGAYHFDKIGQGDFLVRFIPDDPLVQLGWYAGATDRAHATVVHVAGNSPVTGIDAALPAAGDLTGTLTDEVTGDPVGFPVVSLQQSDGAGGWTTVATYHGYYGFGGGPLGYYDFPHLVPGTYRLTADEPGYHDLYLPDGSTPAEGQDLTVAGGQQLVEDATMHRAAAIVGHLSVVRGGTTYYAPYADVRVYARATDGTWQEVGHFGSDRVGDYRVTGLAPGTYRLGFGDGASYQVEYYQDQPTVDQAQDLVVTADHWTVADATLQPPS